jgi:hypothetical protein
MAWIDPVAKVIGALITAAEWNQSIVTNTQYLHDRTLTLWYPSGFAVTVGDYGGIVLANGTSNYISGYIPDDFDSLVSATAYVANGAAGQTLTYGIQTDWGNPASGESATAAGQTGAGLSQLITNANQWYPLNVASYFSGIDAGDLFGFEFISTTITSNALSFAGLKLVINRD